MRALRQEKEHFGKSVTFSRPVGKSAQQHPLYSQSVVSRTLRFMFRAADCVSLTLI